MSAPVGTRNSKSKLREIDIRYIFALRQLGHGPVSLSKEFGVSTAQLHNILTRKSWGHVEIEDELLIWEPLSTHPQNTKPHNWKGGVVDHPYYGSWRAAKSRVSNPNSLDWKFYGGRGITMCEEWLEDSRSFIDYVEENLGPRPEGWSLDRIDVNGNYEPGNIKWSSPQDQAKNRR